MKTLVPLGLVLVMASAVAAQTVPPALFVQEDGKSRPLAISRLDIDARIYGYVAETTTTMTFANPGNRALEGDLYFPLPEGATITGYALDVHGTMVDGVAVEKHEARRVFEKVVRQGIDPGLVEWTKGNVFRTRVFPIPPQGSRTVRVHYVSELIGPKENLSYELPLRYPEKIHEFNLRVEVVRPMAKPEVKQSDFASFGFSKWRDSLVAEAKLSDIALKRDLIVALPQVEKQNVLVERADDGQTYFAIHDFPRGEGQETGAGHFSAQQAPRHIVLFWDTSGSRAKADHTREIGLVKACMESWAKDAGSGVTVDLVLLRDILSQPKQFHSAAELATELEHAQYDGGTQLGAIAQLGDKKPDFYLLVTDGISNFGKEEPAPLDAPLYILSADSTANHAFLHHLANSNGGRYFNLNHVKDADVVAAIGRPAFSFLKAKLAKGQTVDLCPQKPEPISGPFTLVGRLTAEKAEVAINYGMVGGTPEKRTFQVSAADAPAGNLLRRLWAEKRLAELMVSQNHNEKEIVALGKKFGMVTPLTSLLVLESLEQYVEYEIAPPKSLREMRDEYMRRVDTLEHQRQKQKADKMEAVLRMWQERVNWWNNEYKYAKDFKYRAAGEGGDGQRAEGRRGRAGEEAELAEHALRSDMRRELRQLPGPGGGGQPAAPAAPVPEVPPGRSSGDRASTGRPNFVPSTPAASVAPPAKPSSEPAPVPALAIPASAPEPKPEPLMDPAAPADRPMRPGARPERGVLALRQSSGGRSDPNSPSAGRHGEDGAMEKKLSDGEVEPGIVIKAWNPDTPYLKDLKAAGDKAVAAYFKNRPKYADSPAFFLDCADYFAEHGDAVMSLQILSNIAELEIEEAALLRILGHRLEQIGQLDLAVMTFENVLRLRPEEPQSYRDLALVLIRRSDEKAALKAQWTSEGKSRIRDDYARALNLLRDVVLKRWDERFTEIEVTAIEELNRALVHAKAWGLEKVDLDPRLLKLLDVDVRIVMTWHADNTDIDLWVTEPSGEKALYQHNRTTIGGLVSRDFTGGYGPEEYMVRKALHGRYKIEANYFGSQAVRMLGPVTVQVDVFTNYGRPDEQRKSLTLRLKENKETVGIGEIEF